MRLRFVTVVLGLAIPMAGAYAFGFSQAKQQMDSFCGLVISGTGAGHHVPLLVKHNEALAALRAGDIQRAEAVLRFLLRTDASLITECKNEPQCTQLMGNPMPDEATLKAALGQ